MNISKSILFMLMLALFIATGYGEDSQLANNTDTVSSVTVDEVRPDDNITVEKVEIIPQFTLVEDTLSVEDALRVEDAVSPEVIETSQEQSATLSAMADRFEADFTDRDMQRVTVVLKSTTEAADYAKSAENVKITVQKLKQKPDYVPLPNDRLKSRIYGYHNMYVSGLDRTMIKDASVKFKVERQWVKENRLNRDSIRLMRYHGGEWLELKTRVLRVDDSYVYCEASASGFSIFAIVADTLGEEGITGTATPDTTPTKTTPPTNTQTEGAVRPPSQPGFGAVQFLTGLAVISYLMRKRL